MRMGYCEDAKDRGFEACTIGTAIGAAACLPSIGAAGFGYFICAGAVVISGGVCEASVKDEYEQCKDNENSGN